MYAALGPPGIGIVLELATPVEQAAAVLPTLLLRTLLIAALGIMLCGFVVWRMAGELYRPLHAVAAIADQITMNTLAKRIPDEWGDRTLTRLCRVLNEMVGRLQEAFETQGRFVANAAHELRGPLAAMRTQLEVHLRRKRTPDEYEEALLVTLEETKRLSNLAEHLLILARYEHGAGLLLEQDVSLTPLLQHAASEIRRSTGAEVTVTTPESLVLDADPVALERAIGNLIGNGVQAGGGTVRVDAHQYGESVRIAVTDSGRGMTPEEIPHLFEPFWRGDPARTRGGGAGLGLAIVKTVVEAHNGQIEVRSEPGQGSVFTLILPQHRSW